MNPYQFQSEDFALSADGVHLLRNRYNFKTITYDEINEAVIERSAEIRNAPVTLILGILMVLFAFYQSRWVIGLFIHPEGTIYIESIVLPVIPAFLGIYCIYIAIRKGPMLRLETETKSHKMRLRSFFKNDQSIELEKYLAQHLGSRLCVNGLS